MQRMQQLEGLSGSYYVSTNAESNADRASVHQPLVSVIELFIILEK